MSRRRCTAENGRDHVPQNGILSRRAPPQPSSETLLAAARIYVHIPANRFRPVATKDAVPLAVTWISPPESSASRSLLEDCCGPAPPPPIIIIPLQMALRQESSSILRTLNRPVAFSSRALKASPAPKQSRLLALKQPFSTHRKMTDRIVPIHTPESVARTHSPKLITNQLHLTDSPQQSDPTRKPSRPTASSSSPA